MAPGDRARLDVDSKGEPAGLRSGRQESRWFGGGWRLETVLFVRWTSSSVTLGFDGRGRPTYGKLTSVDRGRGQQHVTSVEIPA